MASIDCGSAVISNTGNINTNANGLTINLNGFARQFYISDFAERSFTGGTTTFDVATIRVSTSTGGVNSAGIVEVYITGINPPSGSAFSIRGSRRLVFALRSSGGGLSSTLLEDQQFHTASGGINMPTVSLVSTSGTTGQSTIAIQLGFTESASTLIMRLATHIVVYSGGGSGSGVSWAMI